MQTEKIILGANTKYPLNGILTLPDQTGVSFPAVVFVHGSGASNMDEKVGRLTPFKDLAEGLASHGIASLRYDKRSFGHGLKMLKEKECCTVKEETITDALLATELLRMDSRIDPKKIFLIGHSMGGMLAPRIDAEGGDYWSCWQAPPEHWRRSCWSRPQRFCLRSASFCSGSSKSRSESSLPPLPPYPPCPTKMHRKPKSATA